MESSGSKKSGWEIEDGATAIFSLSKQIEGVSKIILLPPTFYYQKGLTYCRYSDYNGFSWGKNNTPALRPDCGLSNYIFYDKPSPR